MLNKNKKLKCANYLANLSTAHLSLRIAAQLSEIESNISLTINLLSVITT